MNDRRRIHHREGLVEDLAQLRRIQERRRILRALAGASLVPLFGCGSGTSSDPSASSGSSSGSSSGATSSSSSTSSSSTYSSGASATCSEIASETGGPYPGDGSNGPNALETTGIVRSDIRASFGGLTGIAGGVPLTFELQVVSTNLKGNCAPLAGHAVYVWHCDRDAGYSMYGTAANQNYLRGVQPTDANGVAKFQSIFPAAYVGRWPHIHFEIFRELAAATAAGFRVTTSQLAFPEDVCNAVYATPGYEASIPAMKQTPLASDSVFRDGVATQMAAVTGSVAEGIVATLVVGVSA